MDATDRKIQKQKPLHAYSEKEKEERWHLEAELRYTMRSCAHPALDATERAYRRFEGKRDAEELKYMTERYGTEFPAQLTHIPLIKSMINAIIGLHDEQPFPFAVTCRDNKSVVEIHENRVKAIMEEIRLRAMQDLKNNAAKAQAEAQQQMQPQEGQPPQQPAAPAESPTTKINEGELRRIHQQYTRFWKDDLEINGHHIFQASREALNMSEKEREMLLDACISGQIYYQCKVERIGQMPTFRTLDPRRLFHERASDAKYVKQCSRARYEEDVHVIDVINRWGHRMQAKDIESLLERLPRANASTTDMYDARLIEHSRYDSHPHHFVKVNYCEWKSNNEVEIEVGDDELDTSDDRIYINQFGKKIKKRYRLDLYCGLIIGSEIYVPFGKYAHPQRPVDNPWYCDLTINGGVFAIRNGAPQMLVNETADIQDKYDLMFMHWENIVALSGVKAVTIDTSQIPMWMGNNPTQRLMKWIGYLKQGIAAVDLSKSTNPNGSNFSNMGQMDLSLSDSVKVILEMIAFLEETASRVVGVPRQMIGQLTQYDGKATSEMAAAGGSLVIRPLMAFHRDIMKQAYTDLVNCARYAYQDGMKGSYLLGDRNRRVFTIDKGKVPLADLGVFLSDSGMEARNLQELKQNMSGMLTAGLVDAETFVDAFTMQSLSEFKEKLREGIQIQKTQNTGQLQQQLEQAMKQVEQLTKQADGIKQEEIAIRKQEVAGKQQTEAEKLEIMRDANSIAGEFNQGKLALDQERVRLEGLQMSYSNQAMEVKND